MLQPTHRATGPIVGARTELQKPTLPLTRRKYGVDVNSPTQTQIAALQSATDQSTVLMPTRRPNCKDADAS